MGKYKLHEIVGRGGMGVVYRGEHVYIGKEVAVKILHDGYGGREESIKRFLREARAASLINHPNIVDITDFGKSNDGTVFFVMEFLHGEPLDALMQRERRLELIRAITIVNQIAGALGAAHAKGIVHRDLKPENVMLTKREGRRELIRQISDESGLHTVTEREKAFDFVKILDFGVAKVRDPNVSEARVTQQGVVFGTPEYMAPETARIGVSDPRTDIYALGVIFYEMLTGTIPFAGETAVDVMLKVVSEPVTPPRARAPGSGDHPRGRAAHHEGALEGSAPAAAVDGGAARGAAALLRVGSLPPIDRAEHRRGRPSLPVKRNSVQVSGTIGKPSGNAADPERRRCGTTASALAPPAPRRSCSPARRSVRAGRRCRWSFSPTRRRWKKRRRPWSRTALSRPAVMAKGHDEWSEPARPENEDDWAELDIDAPDGTSG